MLEASHLPSLTTVGKKEPWLAAILPVGIKSLGNKKKCPNAGRLNSPTETEGAPGEKESQSQRKWGDMAYLFGGVAQICFHSLLRRP